MAHSCATLDRDSADIRLSRRSATTLAVESSAKAGPMTATESFNGVLRAADTSDEEDVALRAAIVAALRQDVACNGVFAGCGVYDRKPDERVN
jgi:hypothetical protein